MSPDKIQKNPIWDWNLNPNNWSVLQLKEELPEITSNILCWKELTPKPITEEAGRIQKKCKVTLENPPPSKDSKVKNAVLFWETAVKSSTYWSYMENPKILEEVIKTWVSTALANLTQKKRVVKWTVRKDMQKKLAELVEEEKNEVKTTMVYTETFNSDLKKLKLTKGWEKQVKNFLDKHFGPKDTKDIHNMPNRSGKPYASLEVNWLVLRAIWTIIWNRIEWKYIKPKTEVKKRAIWNTFYNR